MVLVDMYRLLQERLGYITVQLIAVIKEQSLMKTETTFIVMENTSERLVQMSGVVTAPIKA